MERVSLLGDVPRPRDILTSIPAERAPFGIAALGFCPNGRGPPEHEFRVCSRLRVDQLGTRPVPCSSRAAWPGLCDLVSGPTHLVVSRPSHPCPACNAVRASCCSPPSQPCVRLRLEGLRLALVRPLTGRPDVRLSFLRAAWGAEAAAPPPAVPPWATAAASVANGALSLAALQLVAGPRGAAIVAAVGMASAASAAYRAASSDAHTPSHTPPDSTRGCGPTAVMAVSAAVVSALESLVSALAPRLFAVLGGAAAMLPVLVSHASLRRRVARGELTPGPPCEAAWRAAHHTAALSLRGWLRHYSADEAPPLARLLSCAGGMTMTVQPGGLGGTWAPPSAVPHHRTCPSQPPLAVKGGDGEGIEREKIDGERTHGSPWAVGGAAETCWAETCAKTGGAERGARGNGGNDDELEAAKRGGTATLAARAAALAAIFLPFFAVGLPFLVASRCLRRWPSAARCLRAVTWRLLRLAVGASGAAFIKWAQWAATRGDLFPSDLCTELSTLHDAAPQHSPAATAAALARAVGPGVSLADVFESIDVRPMASGSVAQVHRARLGVTAGALRGRDAAVKVRHPGCAARIWTDFQLLRPLAAWAGRHRSLRWLALEESLATFAHTMTEQCDLRVEADHMARFGRDFNGAAPGAVVIPVQLLRGICSSPEVLVESFEPGESVATHMRNSGPLNGQLCSLGVETYLRMLLAHNFVHQDLHPGNILVRPGPGGDGPQLVLLDFGLAEQLPAATRTGFISFLFSIGKADGREAADELLKWATTQRCPDPGALKHAMAELFASRCDLSKGAVDLDAVLKRVLLLCREHEVSIDAQYASLVVSCCVLVSFAASLDPQMSLMDAAVPCFLLFSLTGKVNARMYG